MNTTECVRGIEMLAGRPLVCVECGGAIAVGAAYVNAGPVKTCEDCARCWRLLGRPQAPGWLRGVLLKAEGSRADAARACYDKARRERPGARALRKQPRTLERVDAQEI